MAQTIRIPVGADTSQMNPQIRRALSGQKYTVPVEIDASSLGKFRLPLGKITGDITQFRSSLEASTARVLAFGASASVLAGIASGFKQMVIAGLEVEDTMIQINRVFNLTEAELTNFENKLFDVARNTGQSFTVVGKAALELSRQGLSAEETARRLNDALTLTRLAGIDSAESVEVLTATINGFRDAALSSTEIINKLIAVDSAFAVSSNDLANSLSRSSAVAQDAGVSFEELIATTTALQQTTARGGSVIGNALKSIFTRIARPETREELEKIGVATTDTSGNFRGAIPILQDYARVYGTLSDAQKSQTSETIASVYQINILKALIKDLSSENSVYTRALGEATNATDQIAAANEKLNASTLALAQNTGTSVKQLASNVNSAVFDAPIRKFLEVTKTASEYFSQAFDPKKGAETASAFLGGIGDFLAGPGLIYLSKQAFKLGKFLYSDVVGAVKEIGKIPLITSNQLEIQKKVLEGLSQNKVAYEALASGSLTRLQREELLLSVYKQQAAEMRNMASVYGSTLSFAKSGVAASASKNLSKVPNFAQSSNPLEDAVNREVKAGIPRSAVRINQSDRLKSKQNPLGLAVTNVLQEPNGLKDVFGAKASKSGSFIPNFAETGVDVKSILKISTYSKTFEARAQRLIDANVGNLSKTLDKLALQLRNLTRQFGLGKEVFEDLYKATKVARQDIIQTSQLPPRPTQEQLQQQSIIDAQKLSIDNARKRAQETKRNLSLERDLRLGRGGFPFQNEAYDAQLGSLIKENEQSSFYKRTLINPVIGGAKELSITDRLFAARTSGSISDISKRAAEAREAARLSLQSSRTDDIRKEKAQERRQSAIDRETKLKLEANKKRLQGIYGPQQKPLSIQDAIYSSSFSVGGVGRSAKDIAELADLQNQLGEIERYQKGKSKSVSSRIGAFFGFQSKPTTQPKPPSLEVTDKQREIIEKRKGRISQAGIGLSLAGYIGGSLAQSSENEDVARVGGALGQGAAIAGTIASFAPNKIGLVVAAIAGVSTALFQLGSSSAKTAEALRKEIAEKESFTAKTNQQISDYILAQDELNASIERGESAALVAKKQKILNEKIAGIEDTTLKSRILQGAGIEGQGASSILEEFNKQQKDAINELTLKRGFTDFEKNKESISAIIGAKLFEKGLLRSGIGTSENEDLNNPYDRIRERESNLKRFLALSKFKENTDISNLRAAGVTGGGSFAAFSGAASFSDKQTIDRFNESTLRGAAKLANLDDGEVERLVKQGQSGLEQLFNILTKFAEETGVKMSALIDKAAFIGLFKGETQKFNTELSNAIKSIEEDFSTNVEFLKVGRERLSSLIIGPQKENVSSLARSGAISESMSKVIATNLELSLKRADLNVAGQEIITKLATGLKGDGAYLSQADEPLKNAVNKAVTSIAGIVNTKGLDLGTVEGVDSALKDIGVQIEALKKEGSVGAKTQIDALNAAVKELGVLRFTVETTSAQASEERRLIKESYREALVEVFKSGSIFQGGRGTTQDFLKIANQDNDPARILNSVLGAENFLKEISGLLKGAGIVPKGPVGLINPNLDAFGRPVVKTTASKISEQGLAARQFLTENASKISAAKTRGELGVLQSGDKQLLERAAKAETAVEAIKKLNEQEKDRLEIAKRAREIQFSSNGINKSTSRKLTLEALSDAKRELSGLSAKNASEFYASGASNNGVHSRPIQGREAQLLEIIYGYEKMLGPQMSSEKATQLATEEITGRKQRERIGGLVKPTSSVTQNNLTETEKMIKSLLESGFGEGLEKKLSEMFNRSVQGITEGYNKAVEAIKSAGGITINNPNVSIGQASSVSVSGDVVTVAKNGEEPKTVSSKPSIGLSPAMIG